VGQDGNKDQASEAKRRMRKRNEPFILARLHLAQNIIDGRFKRSVTQWSTFFVATKPTGKDKEVLQQQFHIYATLAGHLIWGLWHGGVRHVR
jgi:hypothetical protein